MSQPIGLIQLVSEEAMPSLYPILALKPTALVHVTSHGYELHSEPVLTAAALAHLCPPRESVRHLHLPPMPSITETYQAVLEGIEWLRARGAQPVINFTGGTKLMSIGSFYAAVSTNTSSLYVDGDRQTFVDGRTGPELASVLDSGLVLGALAPLISVRMILTAYGCAVENAKRNFNELAPVAAALLLNREDEMQAFENMAGRTGAFAALRSSKSAARWRGADQIRFDLPGSIGAAAEAAGLVRRAGKQFRLCADLHYDREMSGPSRQHRGPDPGQVLQRRYQFFEGGWWEIAVAEAVEGCSAFADVNVNLTIAKGGRLAMEEDVLVMQGLQLAYFSCKRSGADKLVRHLEEVDASARRLGGKMARKYLAVCHLPECMRDGLRKRADQLHVKLIEPLDVADGVALLNAVSV
jgi:hypothetical protein